jgi:hypothetical protein
LRFRQSLAHSAQWPNARALTLNGAVLRLRQRRNAIRFHSHLYFGMSRARWRGVFYPKGLPRAPACASRRFRSIEINGTFYRLQWSENFACWHDETPNDFLSAIKRSGYATPMLELRNAKRALDSGRIIRC